MALRMRNLVLLLSDEDKDQGEYIKCCLQRDGVVYRLFILDINSLIIK